MFNFLRNCKLTRFIFSLVLFEGFTFSISSPVLSIVCLFNFSHVFLIVFHCFLIALLRCRYHNSVAFSIFRVVQPSQLILKHFHHLPKPTPLSHNSPPTHSRSTGQPLISFLSVELPILDIS